MTAHGIYKFYINGKLASDAALEPEFTTLRQNSEISGL